MIGLRSLLFQIAFLSWSTLVALYALIPLGLGVEAALPVALVTLCMFLANGGVLVEEFEKLASLGGGRELRFRIAL